MENRILRRPPGAPCNGVETCLPFANSSMHHWHGDMSEGGKERQILCKKLAKDVCTAIVAHYSRRLWHWACTAGTASNATREDTHRRLSVSSAKQTGASANLPSTLKKARFLCMCEGGKLRFSCYHGLCWTGPPCVSLVVHLASRVHKFAHI